MGTITIDQERCKGCLLCIKACPKKCIVQGDIPNGKGYLAAVQRDQAACTACSLCALVCPDVAISVYR